MNYTEKEKQILAWCKSLSMSQGLYCRLYSHLTSDEGREYLSHLAAQNFTDSLDFVLYVEQ